MTPREKAHDLLKKYFMIYQSYPYNREAALIAVDEIIEFMSPMVHSKQAYDYWDEVKKEILLIDREITRAESQEAREDKLNEDLY
jgi:hypothetical protein